MEDIKPKKHTIRNLRSILSVGEPLNAEAVIWGEENFGFLFWTIGGKQRRRYMIANYPSESKTRSMENLCLGVEIAIAEVNGKLLK
jgi:acetyl-CoA synthetase